MNCWKREEGLLVGMVAGYQIKLAVWLREGGSGRKKVEKRMLVMKYNENDHLSFCVEYLSVNSE